MKKRNILILIVVAVTLIAGVTYSIFRNDLTTVQSIFAKSSEKAAGTEVTENNTENELQILSLNNETNNAVANNVVNNTNKNNVTNNIINTTDNNVINSNNTLKNARLPAAGAKTFIIWTLIILAIISIISNIKYNNIKLK